MNNITGFFSTLADEEPQYDELCIDGFSGKNDLTKFHHKSIADKAFNYSIYNKSILMKDHLKSNHRANI